MKINVRMFIMLLLCTFIFNNNTWAQSAAYMSENLAITSIDLVDQKDGSFVFQIKLTDFSGKKQLPEGFGFSGVTFTDDGKGNDPKAGDGIYHSKELGDYKKLKNRDFLDVVIVGNQFKHHQKLSKVSTKGIGCKFVPCGCPCDNGTTCNACYWFGWSCWKIESCEISISLSDLIML